MARRLTKEDFIERAKKIHDNKYDYSKVVYVNNKTKICIICPIHGEFWQEPISHLNGYGCKKCGCEITKRKERFTFDEFLEKARAIYGDEYDYSQVEYVNNHTKVCIICKEHGEFWMTPNNHIEGHSCPKCAILKRVMKSKLTMEEFINRARKIHGDKYDYSQVEYFNNHTKVCIICKEHGEFWQTPHDHLSGSGCPNCKTSNLEKEIISFFKNKKIQDYEHGKFYPWLNGLQLDFYLPQYNIAIECQGIQHFKPIGYFGGEKKFEYTLKNDKQKYKLCEENGIKLLYYSNLGIEYPYQVYENKEELLKEIYKNG